MTAVDLLTRAAAKVRETAEATDGQSWYVNREAPDALPDVVAECRGESCEGCGIVAPMVATEVAEHIALWCPVTALLVADWLEVEAKSPHPHAWDAVRLDAALALARSILGEEES